jgi:hypothetical protein
MRAAPRVRALCERRAASLGSRGLNETQRWPPAAPLVRFRCACCVADASPLAVRARPCVAMRAELSARRAVGGNAVPAVQPRAARRAAVCTLVRPPPRLGGRRPPRRARGVARRCAAAPHGLHTDAAVHRLTQTTAVRERGELPKTRAVASQAAAAGKDVMPIDTQARSGSDTAERGFTLWLSALLLAAHAQRPPLPTHRPRAPSDAPCG